MLRCFWGNYLKGERATDDRIERKINQTLENLLVNRTNGKFSRLSPIFSVFSEYDKK